MSSTRKTVQAIDANGNLLSKLFHWARTKTVAYTTTTASGADFGEGVTVVQITTTSAAFFKFGVDGTVTATTSDHYVAANFPYLVMVPPTMKRIAFVQLSAGGSAYIAEMETVP